MFIHEEKLMKAKRVKITVLKRFLFFIITYQSNPTSGTGTVMLSPFKVMVLVVHVL